MVLCSEYPVEVIVHGPDGANDARQLVQLGYYHAVCDRVLLECEVQVCCIRYEILVCIGGIIYDLGISDVIVVNLGVLVVYLL